MTPLFNLKSFSRHRMHMVLYAGWFFILAVSLLWNIHIELKNTHDVVLNKSESFFRQITVSRLWNATHGGVYVPVTEATQPNPYLADSLRDVITTDGLALTKINPAFMTRQIAEINVSNKDFSMHITSLDPIRPANEPDEWETRSLQILHERRNDYVLERIKKDTLDQYRYMAPLITEQACMSCHSHQGYQIGDIRGGIQQGKVKILPSKIDVKVILENTCRFGQQQATAKNIAIECQIPDGLFVMADRQKTETVMRNLLSNAVKFSHQDTTIVVSAFDTHDNMVRFEIKDEGIGMSASQVDSLFKPEFANSQKGTAGEKGTGMGLLLCYEFVALQGGTIGVKSEEEKGSVFCFTLPKA